MKTSFTTLLIFLLGFQSLQAQPPCTLSLDSILLDQQLSTCNNLVFKYKYSGGTPTSYQWTYGDGNSCTCIKPKHFYTRNGSWQVCGKIKDASGCADSLCVSFIVNCANPCDLSGIGIYSADTLSYSCREYEFSAISSSNTRRVLWDFGDGDTSADLFTVHTYQRNGKYKARLIVQDSIACADTADFDLDIFCADSGVICDFYLKNLDTIFSSDCRTVTFQYAYNHNSIYSKISFGDGLSAENDLDISHTYADTGTYLVCIEGTDSMDCKDSTCFSIRVGCGPIQNIREHGIRVNQYPNPFGETLHIQVSENASVQINDLQGRLLYSALLHAGENLLKPDIPQNGYYILMIRSNGVTHIRQLIRD